MNPNSELPWIIFDLNQQLYAISTEMVTGIAQMPMLTAVAGAPDIYLGVANIRGGIVPILDLKKLLGLNSGKEETDRIIAALNFKKKSAQVYIKELQRCENEGDKFVVSNDVFGNDIVLGYTHEQSEVMSIVNGVQKMQAELLSLSDRINTDKKTAMKAGALCTKLIHTIDSSIDFMNNESSKLIITLTNDPASSNTHMGFVVDSVRAVDSLELVDHKGSQNCLFMAKIIGGIAHNDKLKGEILVVDDKQIEETVVIYHDAVEKKKAEDAKKKAAKEKPDNAPKEENSDK